MLNKGTTRIKDIAAKANVSVGTVDRVLHNRGRVSAEVRQKVIQIAEELNYEPNLIARTLGSNRMYHIAALIPDYRLDPYWLAPKEGIEKAERELKQYGITVKPYVFDLYNVDSFLLRAAEVTSEKPDGILIAPVFYRESLPILAQWQQMHIPFVLFNTQITEYAPVSYIGQDSYQSGFLAGKLIHFGQVEKATILIAHIAEDISNSAHLIKKEQGFRDYFLQATTSKNYNVISVDLRSPGKSLFEEQLSGLLQEHPDIKGIFVTTSKAYEIAAYLQKHHRKDIRLVGYDLVEKNLHYLNLEIIHFLINQNPKGQGYWGITYLTELLVFKKQVAPLKYLPLDIITKENLQYYIEASQ